MDSQQAISTVSCSTVDRQARNALIELATAYLTGDIGNEQFDDRKWDFLEHTADASVRVLRYDLWLIHDDFIDHSLSVPRETWNWLLRVVAFLHTDFELTAERRSMWHRKQLVAAGGVLLIGCGAAMSLAMVHWLPFILCWAVAGTLAIAYWQLHDGYYVHPEIEHLGRYAPFRSEVQWRSCAHLVAMENIPAYNPQLHDKPQPTDAELNSMRWKRVLLAPFYGAIVLPWMLRRGKHEIHLVKG